MCPKQPHEWYFGADDGLYKSKYSYRMLDDLNRFTEDGLYKLYSDLLSSDVSAMGEDGLWSHETS